MIRRRAQAGASKTTSTRRTCQRWRTPLGLLWRQRTLELGEEVAVHPNLLEVEKYDLLARKDADLIAGAAAKFGGDLRLAEAARSWLAEAADATPDLDYSAVLAFILGQRES